MKIVIAAALFWLTPPKLEHEHLKQLRQLRLSSLQYINYSNT